MGYILPIENYQSTNYHNRVIHPDRDPYPIERLYPVQLDMSYRNTVNQNEEHRFELVESDKHLFPQQKKTPAHEVRSSMLAAKLHAEMTGVGREINTYI